MPCSGKAMQEAALLGTARIPEVRRPKVRKPAVRPVALRVVQNGEAAGTCGSTRGDQALHSAQDQLGPIARDPRRPGDAGRGVPAARQALQECLGRDDQALRTATLRSARPGRRGSLRQSPAARAAGCARSQCGTPRAPPGASASSPSTRRTAAPSFTQKRSAPQSNSSTGAGPSETSRSSALTRAPLSPILRRRPAPAQRPRSRATPAAARRRAAPRAGTTGVLQRPFHPPAGLRGRAAAPT